MSFSDQKRRQQTSSGVEKWAAGRVSPPMSKENVTSAAAANLLLLQMIISRKWRMEVPVHQMPSSGEPEIKHGQA